MASKCVLRIFCFDFSEIDCKFLNLSKFRYHCEANSSYIYFAATFSKYFNANNSMSEVDVIRSVFLFMNELRRD